MPEGPELHIAARFINSVAKKYTFGGPIEKSEVSTKNPSVAWSAEEYRIEAETRGKELKVFLTDAKKSTSSTHILFRFGMSGCFKLTEASDIPKHAHLRFKTIGLKPALALCFVDYRRFGRWEIDGDWGKDRGPDPIFEYDDFRENILSNLGKAAFSKPLCETMLNQKYFNGIGNYLRAEIIYRYGAKPFDEAKTVLEEMVAGDVKTEGPDLLELCNIVPKEVLNLDAGKSYGPGEESQKSQDTFSAWLQCYYVDGMKNLEDGNKRTMWFMGEAGSLAPKLKKVKGRNGKKGSQIPQSGKVVPKELDIKEEVKEEPVELPTASIKSDPSIEAKPPKASLSRKTKKATSLVKEESSLTKAEIKSKPGKVKAIKKPVPTALLGGRKRASDAATNKPIKQPRKSSSRRASADVDFKNYF